VTLPSYSFTTAQGKEKVLESTDYFTKGSSDGIILLGGKTGYTEAAGYCFVGQFSDGQGREVISVIMGSDSKQSRFDQTEAAVRWSLDNFNW
jgi:D-alanyl-D-alanine carboxypeptidase